jgi:hypothetical protein
MVAHKKHKPETGKPEPESLQREDRQQIRPRQAVAPAPDDGAPSSANSPDNSKKVDDYGPLMKALGTTNRDFAKELYGQILRTSARGADKIDGEALFFTLAVLINGKAVDELAAMHRAQMAAVHTAAMQASGDLGRADCLADRDNATRRLIQLTRTYTAQLEACKVYESGERRVTVQNVSVTEGGQAIVGNVSHAPATPRQNQTNAAPAHTDARQTAMENISDAERVPIPVAAKQKA